MKKTFLIFFLVLLLTKSNAQTNCTPITISSNPIVLNPSQKNCYSGVDENSSEIGFDLSNYLINLNNIVVTPKTPRGIHFDPIDIESTKSSEISCNGSLWVLGKYNKELNITAVNRVGFKRIFLKKHPLGNTTDNSFFTFDIPSLENQSINPNGYPISFHPKGMKASKDNKFLVIYGSADFNFQLTQGGPLNTIGYSDGFVLVFDVNMETFVSINFIQGFNSTPQIANKNRYCKVETLCEVTNYSNFSNYLFDFSGVSEIDLAYTNRQNYFGDICIDFGKIEISNSGQIISPINFSKTPVGWTLGGSISQAALRFPELNLMETEVVFNSFDTDNPNSNLGNYTVTVGYIGSPGSLGMPSVPVIPFGATIPSQCIGFLFVGIDGSNGNGIASLTGMKTISISNYSRFFFNNIKIYKETAPLNISNSYLLLGGTASEGNDPYASFTLNPNNTPSSNLKEGIVIQKLDYLSYTDLVTNSIFNPTWQKLYTSNIAGNQNSEWSRIKDLRIVCNDNFQILSSISPYYSFITQSSNFERYKYTNVYEINSNSGSINRQFTKHLNLLPPPLPQYSQDYLPVLGPISFSSIPFELNNAYPSIPFLPRNFGFSVLNSNLNYEGDYVGYELYFKPSAADFCDPNLLVSDIDDLTSFDLHYFPESFVSPPEDILIVENLTGIETLDLNVICQQPDLTNIGGNFNVILGKKKNDKLDLIENTENINIYPNPAKDIIVIKSSIKNSEISIQDFSGREILSFTKYQISSNNESYINIAGLSDGIYFVLIRDSENKSVVYKNKLIIVK